MLGTLEETEADSSNRTFSPQDIFGAVLSTMVQSGQSRIHRYWGALNSAFHEACQEERFRCLIDRNGTLPLSEKECIQVVDRMFSERIMSGELDYSHQAGIVRIPYNFGEEHIDEQLKGIADYIWEKTQKHDLVLSEIRAPLYTLAGMSLSGHCFVGLR